MRAFNSEGRPDANASQHGALQRVRVSAGRGRLACLLVHAAWFLMLAPALAADEPDGILQLIGESVRASHPESAQPAGTLVEAAQRPDGHDALVADLPYPQTDAPDKLSLEQLEAIAKLPPRANRAGMRVHPAMLPLFHDMILHYTGGNYDNAPIHFRLHMPEPFEPGKKYPMVVWLHGAGECGSDNVNQLAHLHHMIPSLVGPKKRDFFLLASQCPHTHGSWEAPERCLTTVRSDGAVECHLTDDPVALGNAPISFTLAMVEAVMRDYPVDPNRVTVAGLSSGGRGVWKILERRPDLFAAAVPIVSWQAIGEKSLREKPLLKKIPIWAIYSSDDSGIDYARREFQRLRDAGCRVHKTEFGVCGHRAWTPAMLQGDIFGWLVSRAKDGDRYYAAESSPTGPDKIGIFADVTVGDMARKPTLAPPKPNRAKEPLKSKPSTPPAYPNLHEPKKTDVATGTSMVTADRVTIIASGGPHGSYPPVYSRPVPASTTVNTWDRVRVELVARYLAVGEVDKALAVADKVKHNHEALFRVLLNAKDEKNKMRLLEYVDRRLDRLEQAAIKYDIHSGQRMVPAHPRGGRGFFQPTRPAERSVPRRPAPAAEEVRKNRTLEPIPAGKKSPMEECGKEWVMGTTTQYGLFPGGWEKEAENVPPYVLVETGRQLRDRLAEAFEKNDLDTMRAMCNSFIKLDDIPLSSPWFDTSGGRLKGRIQYTLNAKARPVVRLLRDIARVQAESKKEFVDLAQKALDRIEKITNPKEEKQAKE